ncbi:hypothetical protein L484_015243 [Morus notabilis]|uniref:Uncharacterized protein n=1 Tax=Morus notabilis TaxID=981085 RepID=W9SJ51_9ROSA|nr:hypothetical protein L484_015243 [Morus notabilis]
MLPPHKTVQTDEICFLGKTPVAVVTGRIRAARSPCRSTWRSFETSRSSIAVEKLRASQIFQSSVAVDELRSF